MSKCLKCGADLPSVGECPTCAAADTIPSGAPVVPSLLNKDIHIDRRRTPERTPAVTEPAVPSFADLARGPAAPPGMTPARHTAAPTQPVAPAAPRTPTPPMGLQTPGAQPPPAMPPAERLPVPPPMPAPPVAASPQAMPAPQRLPVPGPGPATPSQRIPVPSPAAPSAAAPQAAPHVPMPGVPAPPPLSRQAASDDPDATAPGQPPFRPAAAPSPVSESAPAAPPVPRPGAPAPAALSQAAEASPDDTAPGQPSFAARPAPEAPTAMATSALRAELPVPPETPRAQPVAPEPGTASRPQPVSVVTFSPPTRHQTVLPSSPALLPSDEQLTPRLPMQVLPPVSDAPPQPRAGVSTAARKPTGDELQEIHARPASLWRRLLSFTIDTAALVGVATLYITLASSIAGVKAPSSQGLTALDSIAAWMHALKSVLLPGFVLLLVLATVYCAVAAFLWNGRTLGRLLLGLRLVDTHGVAPAPTRAILRAMLSVVSFGLFLGGFWMALFDRRGQTLHDKLTSTFVVQPS